MTTIMRVALAVALVAAVLMLPGCSDPMPEGLALGESAEVGGWKVTVKSVEVYDDQADREPEEEGTVFLAARENRFDVAHVVLNVWSHDKDVGCLGARIFGEVFEEVVP